MFPRKNQYITLLQTKKTFYEMIILVFVTKDQSRF